jgi:hypothetical protein
MAETRDGCVPNQKPPADGGFSNPVLSAGNFAGWPPGDGEAIFPQIQGKVTRQATSLYWNALWCRLVTIRVLENGDGMPP